MKRFAIDANKNFSKRVFVQPNKQAEDHYENVLNHLLNGVVPQEINFYKKCLIIPSSALDKSRY